MLAVSALLSAGVPTAAGAPTAANGAGRSMHPGCRVPDPRGYLLYLAFAQQFNNQLISVVESVRLAQHLGRVLVLTGFMEHAKTREKSSDGHDYYDGDHQLHPFGE